MGDENSLQGRTQAHKHEAASSTGGFLETGLTGITNLSQGSIVYGNASEIVTELSPSSDSDVLTLASGVPSWVTPTPVVSAFNFLDYFEQTVSGTNMDLSWSSLSFDDISSIHILFNVEPSYDPTNIELQYSQGGSLITTSTYESRWTGLGSRTSGGTVTGDSWLIHEARDRKRVGGFVDIFGATSLVTVADRQIMGATSLVTDSAPAGSWSALDNTTQLSPQTIDGIRLSCWNTGGSAAFFEAGSYITAFYTSNS